MPNEITIKMEPQDDGRHRAAIYVDGKFSTVTLRYQTAAEVAREISQIVRKAVR